MAKRLKVTVTQKHINTGVPENGFTCPISLSVQDILKRPRVYTGSHVAVLWENNPPPRERRYRNFRLSKRAKSFMDKFDRKEKVVPTNFILEEFYD